MVLKLCWGEQPLLLENVSVVGHADLAIDSVVHLLEMVLETHERGELRIILLAVGYRTLELLYAFADLLHGLVQEVDPVLRVRGLLIPCRKSSCRS